MNESTRKALTIYLGECWKTTCFECSFCRQSLYNNETDYCERIADRWHGNKNHFTKETAIPCRAVFKQNNRSFTTPDDADALRRKMVEKGDFWGLDSFLDWADTKWESDCKWDEQGKLIDDNFINYLMENFNELAGEFITGKEG